MYIIKTHRWRKIQRVTEQHATKLMCRFHHHEEIKIQWDVRLLNHKEEMEILNTLNSYANIIIRTTKVETYLSKKEWVHEITNFAD